MWWCVLTRPGVTTQLSALSVTVAAGSLPGGPTPTTSPSRTATQPPGTSPALSVVTLSVVTLSIVTTTSAPATTRSTGEVPAGPVQVSVRVSGTPRQYPGAH